MDVDTVVMQSYALFLPGKFRVLLLAFDRSL